MHRFLDHLAAGHGSVRSYVRAIGVGEAELADLTRAVLA
jgi:hypothetical protein